VRRSPVGGVVAIGAVIAVVALVALTLFGGGGAYTVTARFVNAGQLVPGNPVQSGGTTIGSITKIELTDDSLAEVTFEVDELHSPLPRDTRAAIRQFSASGIANRYIDLQIPPDTGQGEIADGGSIAAEDTETQVDLDQVLNAVDEDARRALQDVLQGLARSVEGQGDEANRGLRYLNPSLSTSSRLFRELARDTPTLERTLIGTAKLVTALSERRDDLAALVGNARATTHALAGEKTALAESVARLPPFLRRTNTTLLNTRAALDDVDPLVEVSKPVARRLRPFLAQARGLAADAKPTLSALRSAIRRRGSGNDAVELLRAVPRLAEIAVVEKRRSVAPGGRAEGVGEVPGTFPQAVSALEDAKPVIAFGRPYTTDFLGWLDDFSSSGGYFDGLGASTRTWISFAENIDGAPPKLRQFHRCPGGADMPYKDGSNVLSPEQQQELGCREADRAVR
jgi:phospholipid/cholesterol/gamma-HCH transport system substrate-binding protein